MCRRPDDGRRAEGGKFEKREILWVWRMSVRVWFKLFRIRDSLKFNFNVSSKSL